MLKMCNRSWVVCSQKLNFFYTKLTVKNNVTNLHRLTKANFSSMPNKPSFFKKNSKFLISGGAIGCVTLGYLYFKSDSKEVSFVGEEEPIVSKFVDPHLDESLSLWEEYGPVPYLLIGAGTASLAAFRAIRTNDPKSKVLVIGNEAFYPYMRPPLSKEMWFSESAQVANDLRFKQWNGKERSLFYEENNFYMSTKDLLASENGGVTVLRGIQVSHIDPTEKLIFLSNGKKLAYEKCLLATGGKPKNLPIFENADKDIKKHVTLFRNIEDFQKLDRITKKIKSITIIGGGFLGSELACALGQRSKKTDVKVIQLFPESGNMGKILPDYLSNWATEKVSNEGVAIFTNTNLERVSKDGKRIRLHVNKGPDIVTDHVVVAVGLEPNVELAKSSGLETDTKHGGFLVNAELEARRNLWIAGDAACFYDIKLGRRRVEHHDHAVVSGRLAGENMTGAGKPYRHQSMFWSDLGPEIGYEAIGIVDSSLPTVGIFAKATDSDTPKAIVEATDESIRSDIQMDASSEMHFETTVPRPPEPEDNFGKGIVFYLRDKTIVGIILWNVFTKMPIARKIINDAKQNDDLTEVAKLFNLKVEDVENIVDG